MKWISTMVDRWRARQDAKRTEDKRLKKGSASFEIKLNRAQRRRLGMRIARSRRPFETVSTGYVVLDSGLALAGRSRLQRRRLHIGRPSPLVKTRSN